MDDSHGPYSDLRALYINCTLKRPPETSNTQGLADSSIAILRENGVSGQAGSTTTGLASSVAG